MMDELIDTIYLNPFYLQRFLPDQLHELYDQSHYYCYGHDLQLFIQMTNNDDLLTCFANGEKLLPFFNVKLRPRRIPPFEFERMLKKIISNSDAFANLTKGGFIKQILAQVEKFYPEQAVLLQQKIAESSQNTQFDINDNNNETSFKM